MVKGTSRNVIVVDSPDTELFEQAIFIVRSDILSSRGVTPQMLVDEACRVARGCAGDGRPRRIRAALPLLCCCAGAAVLALAWLLITLL